MTFNTLSIHNRNFRFISFLLCTGMLIVFTSCSSESFTQQENKREKGEQTLSFTEIENGSGIHYEVNFKNGKISSIYKDNVKIPENEMEDYKDIVNNKLSSMIKDNRFYVFHDKPHSFHFDMKEFKGNMKEWKENFKADQFKFKFDNEKFKADMERLKEELKDLDKIVIKIDKDKIKKDLDELNIHKFDFDFDMDELNKNLKQITIELEKNDNKLEFDMKELEKEMGKLDKEMTDLSGEMEKLDKEMKILDNFLNDVKKELVKDGFIGNPEEKFNLELNEDEMEINNEKVSDSLYSKYRDLYRKHYGKDLNEKIKFQIK